MLYYAKRVNAVKILEPLVVSQDSPPFAEEEYVHFSLKIADIPTEDVDLSKKTRVFEYQLNEHLQLLDIPLDVVPPADVVKKHISLELCTSFGAEARARNVDGWRIGSDEKKSLGIWVMNPGSKFRLVDDDKQKGLAQHFITDMFQKMRISSAQDQEKKGKSDMTVFEVSQAALASYEPPQDMSKDSIKPLSKSIQPLPQF